MFVEKWHKATQPLRGEMFVAKIVIMPLYINTDVEKYHG